MALTCSIVHGVVSSFSALRGSFVDLLNRLALVWLTSCNTLTGACSCCRLRTLLLSHLRLVHHPRLAFPFWTWWTCGSCQIRAGLIEDAKAWKGEFQSRTSQWYLYDSWPTYVPTEWITESQRHSFSTLVTCLCFDAMSECGGNQMWSEV